MRHLFPDYQYVTLENPDVRERALNDPRGFLNTYKEQVIFDEVQQTPQLFSYLQEKVDNDRQMGQFVLSGSQNFQLLQSITQSLAGRVALFKLLPLTFQELKPLDLLPKQWYEAAFKGFYPALYDRDIEPTDFYRNYVETYLELMSADKKADAGVVRFVLLSKIGDASLIPIEQSNQLRAVLDGTSPNVPGGTY